MKNPIPLEIITRTRLFVLWGILITLLFGSGCSDEGNPAAALLLAGCLTNTPAAPVTTEFSNPQKVTLNGYTGHAMEPFITRDDSALFFNSLNDGQDTSLYYATRVSDIEFTAQGKINGVNGTPPHLDAVASMTTGNRFYWVSTRDYPANFHNLMSGDYAAGTVTGISRVDGDFYIEIPGWIVMDAEVSPDGQNLYYVNAFFTGAPFPALSDIGVATLSGGSFIKLANTDGIMANVNTCDCLEYAPSISADGLELFFTRLKFSIGRVEILVAKRSSVTEPFGMPERINVQDGFVEAPSLSGDGKRLYYHYKENETHVIYMMERP